MKPIWKIFSVYTLALLLMLICQTTYGQKICKQDICVVEFNADWNDKNKVEFLNELKNCGIVRININEGDCAKEYNITVVPTIIIFNGKEVERFLADLSFQLTAKLDDIQDVVDEINMDKF